MKSIPRLSLSFLLLVFWACSNEAVVEEKDSAQPGAAAISIVTLDNGIVLNKDGTVPVSLAFNDQYLKKKGTDVELVLEAVLKAQDGTQVATVSFDAIKTTDGTLPSISLPALQAGYYQLTFTLKENGATVSEKTLSFFSDSGAYTITRLSSYPLSLLPGSSGILKVSAKYPEGKDPFIRWTVDGKTVQESSVSSGGSVYSWTAPVKEGVYSVKAELFPVAPLKGSFSFPSTVFLTGQVYVSKKERLEETDFSPEALYYSLFHLRGNLNDNGTRPEKKTYGDGNLDKIGKPSLHFSGDVFGYSFDGSSGFKTEQYLVPLSKGTLHPFTVRFRALVSDSPESRTWFDSRSGDGSFAFSVFTNEEGVFSYSLSSGDRKLTAASETIPKKNEPLIVELSVSPKAGKIVSEWKFNGSAGKPAEEEFELEAIPEQGSSRLAGEKGFVGILDEFGVTDDFVASKPVAKVLYSLTAASEKNGYAEQGEVSVKEGSLRLAPGAELSSLPVELTDGVYSILLKSDLFSTAEEGEVVIDLVSSDGIHVFPAASFHKKGSGIVVSLGDARTESASEGREAVTLVMKKNKTQIEFDALGEKASITQPEHTTAMIFLVRNSKQATSQLSIQKVEISKE